jgi:multiple sugar transport system substrate-binding protein
MRLTRRNVLQGASALTMASTLPLGRFGMALAATEEERIVAAAKDAGGAELSGMIWSNYFVGMQPAMEKFRAGAGIGVGGIQDISIFDIPQRAMAEALSRSPQFDFFHVDSNMIPSLASAGLLEPLDEYMQAADFKIDAVGDYANFMTYKGNTYGVPTDGNVHIQYIRRDLLENPDLQKRFEDQHGEPMQWPETWEQDNRLMTFLHDPDNGIWGSCNLRNRANGATWWYQIFYSAGGFPFDDDMNPTLDTDAGKYAVEWYLKEKEAGHPESPGWGTPQMIPRMTQGHAAMCQYWDGIIPLNENPETSKTVGKWLYGLVPGSDLSGKRVHRSISSPLAAILVNRYSPRKAQAAYLALYWGTLENSAEIVADRVNTFHDPWHSGHMDHPKVVEAYTAEGMAAVRKNLEIVAPPVYMTGYLEFQDTLAKNLSEAYVGQLPADQVLSRTEEEWGRIIRRTGASKLKEELASYKAVMPTRDTPTSA